MKSVLVKIQPLILDWIRNYIQENFSDSDQELLDELKKIFDVIIFDGAPCLLVTDSTVLSRIVDSTILVASHKNTKIDDLKEAKNRIEVVGGHVSGVVLNRVKMSSKRYENKYYYASTSSKSGTRTKPNSNDDEQKVNADDIMEQIKKYNQKKK